jgi:hypothetical protein
MNQRQQHTTAHINKKKKERGRKNNLSWEDDIDPC